MKEMKDYLLLLRRHISIFCGILWLVWLSLNAILLYLSSSMPVADKLSTFFPVNYMDAPGLWSYDVSEFVIYGFVVPYMMYANVKYYHKHSKEKYVKVYDVVLSVFIAFSFILVAFVLMGNNEVAKWFYVILRGCFNGWLGTTIADALFYLFHKLKFE